MAPASWTVLAATVTWMTTTACRVVATGPPAGGLPAPPSHRPGTLRSRPARCPAKRVSPPALSSPSSGPLLCHSGGSSSRLGCPPPPACRSGPTSPPATPSWSGTPAGRRAQLPRPGAQRSHPWSVLRSLIIPEVLNVIAANLGGHRVRGLVTAVGSSDPTPDTRSKKWTEEGRKVWLSVRPSVRLSGGSRRLLKHGQRAPGRAGLG